MFKMLQLAIFGSNVLCTSHCWWTAKRVIIFYRNFHKSVSSDFHIADDGRWKWRRCVAGACWDLQPNTGKLIAGKSNFWQVALRYMLEQIPLNTSQPPRPSQPPQPPPLPHTHIYILYTKDTGWWDISSPGSTVSQNPLYSSQLYIFLKWRSSCSSL